MSLYLTELSWLYVAQLIRFLAVGVCLGTSTVVMTLYFVLVSRGKTEPAEARMMQILYRILRVGMALAMLTEVTNLIYYYYVDNFIYWTDNPELLMRLTIFGVIIVNALAMQFRKISMWLGPVFAGGSWYAYFIGAVDPVFILSDITLNLVGTSRSAITQSMYLFPGQIQTQPRQQNKHKREPG